MNTATSVSPSTSVGVSTEDDSGTSNGNGNGTEEPNTSDDTNPDETTATSSDPTTSPEESGPLPEGSSCTYTCSTAADCVAGGMSYGHTCQMGKCVIPCSNDDGCVAYFSGWTIETCTNSEDCELGTCVVFEGGNGCAFTPDLGDCADLGLDEVQRMTTEGDTVPVCTEPDAVCADLGTGNECILPCTEFTECYMRQTGEVCTPDGECVYACVAPADCPMSNFDNVTPGCE